MSIQNDINELIQAEIITQDSADKIRNYYLNKGLNQSKGRLLIVFSILGAILVGLGIILILAHNWDDLSTSTKTIFAFLPTLVGQAICGYVILKLNESDSWREGGTAFLFFAVGSSISLISQIYNITTGNLSGFLLIWMILCLPLIYLMKSSIASILYIIGITFYACETNYWSYPSQESYIYWILFLLVIPHYYILYKNNSESNFLFFHNWLIPLSIIITLGTIADKHSEIMFIAYFSLLGLFYLIGNTPIFIKQRPFVNSFRILGERGTIVLLLVLSFDFFWESLRKIHIDTLELISSAEFITAFLLTFIAAGLLIFQQRNKPVKEIQPISIIFILFLFTFLIGLFTPYAVILINIFVFTIGLYTIWNGSNLDNLGILNYGLLIITALVVCRFFDTDLSFVMRGILFILVGLGFFTANYVTIKRRGTNEK